MSYLADQQAGFGGFGSMKPSMYETVVSGGLSEELLQHKVVHFSGTQLNSEWTFRDIQGTGSNFMRDDVNGGLSIQTGAGSGDNSQIDFNDINHYANNGSVLIATTINQDIANINLHVGFTEQATSNDTRAIISSDPALSFISFLTAVNGVPTSVDTAVAPSNDLFLTKIELRSSSALVSIDDSLQGIITSNLPDVAMQPIFRSFTTTTSTKRNRILDLEVYNT